MSEKFYSKFEKSPRAGKKDGSLRHSAPRNDVGNSAPRNNNKNSNHKNNGLLRSACNDGQFLSSSPKILHSSFADFTSPIIANFDEIIQGVRPLNSKQKQQLPDNIRSLSHQLTDDRASRRLGYMNDNIQLSSYIRYYTWWNLVRLTKLFANLPASIFPSQNENGNNGDSPLVCLDLGTGPLTVIIALWIARPELRNRKFKWYCLDVSGNAMSLGEDVYLSIAASSGETPWQIVRVKGPFGTNLREKADFITCANMFNELDQASDMPPEFQSKKYFDQLSVYAKPYANFLLIEPGVPKASRTLSLLRTRFINAGFSIESPCPHALDCPMNGFKAYTGSSNKWCNFAFNTENAPAKLLKLSELAKLPKERATLCYLAVCGKKTSDSKETNNTNEILCRVASDPFKLPGNKTGFYACSKLGLTLLKGNRNLKSGDLISVKIKTPDSLPKDEKSGALIIEL